MRARRRSDPGAARATRGARIAVASSICLALAAAGTAASPAAASDEGGLVDVLVEVDAGQSAIAAQQDAVLAGVADLGHRVGHRYETLPWLALSVDHRALARLDTLPEVSTVVADEQLTRELNSSVPLVNADDVWARGLEGTGSTVAVLDDGFDSTHPMLRDKLVGEACFAAADAQGQPGCPDGSAEQVGRGAASEGCGPTSGGFLCAHGTHVAGIAVGHGSALAGAGFDGVARRAGLLAIRVFPGDGAPNAATSDILKGLEWVYEQRDTHDIAAVNLSLGGRPYDSPCDEHDGNRPLALAVANLESAGIATVAASGNQHESGAIASPACLSGVLAVGATYADEDTLVPSSNVSDELGAVAPGHEILSADAASGGYVRATGTSAAAPHAAGALALLRESHPDAAAATLVAALRASGEPVHVDGLHLRRIDVDEALDVLAGRDIGRHPYPDVPTTAYFDAAVSWLHAEAITTGTAAGRYEPYRAISRGETVALAHRTMGQPGGAPAHAFPDVGVPAPYFDTALDWAAAMGITTGTTDGTFRPHDEVTRGQMASLLWRLLGRPAPDGRHEFDDVAPGRHYDEAVSWLAEQGIVSGHADGRYRPHGALHRGEMAKLLHELARQPLLWQPPSTPPPTAIMR